MLKGGAVSNAQQTAGFAWEPRKRSTLTGRKIENVAATKIKIRNPLEKVGLYFFVTFTV